MELLQLRYFKAAAELENFSAVAEKFYVPQPSISATIKKLEKELGVKLFDRNGKRITLNSNGKLFYEKVDVALGKIDEGVMELSNEKKHIVIYPQAATRFISLLIADFHLSRNDVVLSTVSYSENLKRHYDFTIMQPIGDMAEFDYIELMTEEIILLASKKNKKFSTKKEVSLSDLKEERFIGHYDSMNIRQFTDNFCQKEAGFKPHVIQETNDNLMIRYFVGENNGVALLPSGFFQLQPTKHSNIIKLKEKAYRTVVLAWEKGKELDPQEKEFVQYVYDWFEKFRK